MADKEMVGNEKTLSLGIRKGLVSGVHSTYTTLEGCSRSHHSQSSRYEM